MTATDADRILTRAEAAKRRLGRAEGMQSQPAIRRAWLELRAEAERLLVMADEALGEEVRRDHCR